MWPFVKRTTKQVLLDLKKEEKMEEDLISFYASLMESGIDQCLDDDLIDQTYNNLQILKTESERHRVIIKSIINKYE